MDRQAQRVFSSREALHFGWTKVCENLRPLIALGLVGGFIALLHQTLTHPESPGVAPLLAIGVQLLQAAVMMTYLRVALQLEDGRALDFSSLQVLLANYFTYLLTTLLYSLIVFAGLLLLIVPGVIWGLKFGYAPFLVLDGKYDPIAALRESERLTKGVKRQLLGLAFLIIAMNVLGALAFGVGMLVTLPTGFVAAAHVMRRLQARAGGPVSPPASTPEAFPTGGVRT